MATDFIFNLPCKKLVEVIAKVDGFLNWGTYPVFVFGFRLSISPVSKTVFLGKNDNGSFHTETVVQSTDVVIHTGFGEHHAEARDSQGRLGEPNPVLRCGLDKARVHAVGG